MIGNDCVRSQCQKSSKTEKHPPDFYGVAGVGISDGYLKICYFLRSTPPSSGSSVWLLLFFMLDGFDDLFLSFSV